MNAPTDRLDEDPGSPFSLEAPRAYARWREAKLDAAPKRVEDLVVQVRDPRALTDVEAETLRRVCAVANMAIYASPLAGIEDKDIARSLGRRLGLERLHANMLSDDDGVSSLEAHSEKSGRGYIPYSNQRLLWHTDGYYNAPHERIRAFVLHCVRPAAAGGANRLLDPEIAYILLRDADPGYVRSLSAPDAMTIPPNVVDGREIRPVSVGPVFSVEAGMLQMRYTARTRSIAWKPDAATRSAVEFLARMLETSSPWIFTLRMEGGQGLVCNNVLHDRSAYTDAPGAGRLVYRARYTDRVAAPQSFNARNGIQHA